MNNYIVNGKYSPEASERRKKEIHNLMERAAFKKSVTNTANKLRVKTYETVVNSFTLISFA